LFLRQIKIAGLAVGVLFMVLNKLPTGKEILKNRKSEAAINFPRSLEEGPSGAARGGLRGRIGISRHREKLLEHLNFFFQ
jgi:hypothetical protein